MDVGIIIYDGVEELDFVGPFEVFANIEQAENEVSVFTVAEQKIPIKGDGGLLILPNLTFVECPSLDILVVPGGPGRKFAMHDDAILGFIKSQAKNCSYILSVCTGAFILAHAELLRGKRATTHHKAIEELTNSNLVGEVVRSKRFVVDGQVITTAGVTAGIDGALETVKRSLGQGASSKISKIIEYEGQE